MGILDFFLWLLIGLLPAVAIAILPPQLSTTKAVEGWLTFGLSTPNWSLELLWPLLLRLSLSTVLGHVLAGALGSIYDSLALLLRAMLVVGVGSVTALFATNSLLSVYESALGVFTVLALGLQSLMLFGVATRVSSSLRNDFVGNPTRKSCTIALIIIGSFTSLIVVLLAYWSYSQRALDISQAVWATIATSVTMGTVVLGFLVRQVTLFDSVLFVLFNTLLITQHYSPALGDSDFLTLRFGCHVALWLIVGLAFQLRNKLTATGLVHFGLALLFAAETYVAGTWLEIIAALPSFWFIVQSLLNCVLYLIVHRRRNDDDDHDD